MNPQIKLDLFIATNVVQHLRTAVFRLKTCNNPADAIIHLRNALQSDADAIQKQIELLQKEFPQTSANEGKFKE